LIRVFRAQGCREVLALARDGKMGVHLDGSRSVGVSQLEVIEGPSGRRRRTKAEHAWIAAESLMPRAAVADVARKQGTTRWQIYDWREQIPKGSLMLPESVAALPVFAELVVAESELALSGAGGCLDIEIVVGDVVIRCGAGADEGQLTRAIRAARAAAS
jgi:transposase